MEYRKNNAVISKATKKDIFKANKQSLKNKNFRISQNCRRIYKTI